jgi:hypothetical protein
MFKYRLSRLPFAILLYGHQFLTIGLIGSEIPGSVWIVAASIPIVMILVILPRVRDCDWPQWVGFLTMIPYLGTLTGTALLFARPKVFNRSDASNGSPSESTVTPRQLVGSICDTCGTKIILATDGVILGNQVLCNACKTGAQVQERSATE